MLRVWGSAGMMAAMYAPLCEAWPVPPSGCPYPLVTGSPAMAASEVLWERSGRRYGSCSVELRPCAPRCAPSAGSWTRYDGAGWPSLGLMGLVTIAECGGCLSAGCGCSSAPTLRLPGVREVTEVEVDGVVLAEDAWVLYDGGRLVRVDGEAWPLCQDWTVVSGEGAWSVTAVVGEEVPTLGMFAQAELARVYEEWCTSGTCRLPAYTTGVTRQGVSQQFPSPLDLRKANLMGLPMVDAFLGTVNPEGLSSGPRIVNPDDWLDQDGPGYRTRGVW